MSASLDVRYGRTPARRRRTRLAVIGGLVLLVVATVVWLVTVGPLAGGPAVQTQDLGFRDVTDRGVTVRASVSAPPGSAMTCVFEADDATGAIVGWKSVELPPSDTVTRTLEVALRTTGTPVVGLINHCRLT
ncbi:MAG: DUF4307 domain-containing protein [Actinomycetales bacterium]|nr:DUF4307 domain-containing protein [Actinomycetales bacterium]